MQLSKTFMVPTGLGETVGMLTDLDQLARSVPGVVVQGTAAEGYLVTLRLRDGHSTTADSGLVRLSDVTFDQQHQTADLEATFHSSSREAVVMIAAKLQTENSQTSVDLRLTTGDGLDSPRLGDRVVAEFASALRYELSSLRVEEDVEDGQSHTSTPSTLPQSHSPWPKAITATALILSALAWLFRRLWRRYRGSIE